MLLLVLMHQNNFCQTLRHYIIYNTMQFGVVLLLYALQLSVIYLKCSLILCSSGIYKVNQGEKL